MTMTKRQQDAVLNAISFFFNDIEAPTLDDEELEALGEAKEAIEAVAPSDVPVFEEHTANLFEVTLKAMVEVGFSREPAERDLKLALLENALDYIDNTVGHEEFVDAFDDNVTFEFVDRHSLA